MGAILRSVVAIVVAAIAAMVAVTLFELVSTMVFPLPAGIDPMDAESLRTVVDQIPAGAFVLILLGWASGSFVGAWLAGRLAGRAPLVHGMTIAALALIGGVMNMLAIPHPLWVWVSGILAFLVCGIAGARLAAKPRTASA